MELGVGDIVGNPLLQALDSAVRGLGVGDAVKLKVSGGPFVKELLFKVPADHPEVARLNGRYKSCAALLSAYWGTSCAYCAHFCKHARLQVA